MPAPEPIKNLRVGYKRATTYILATVVFAGPELIRLIDVAGREIRINRSAWGFTFRIKAFHNA